MDQGRICEKKYKVLGFQRYGGAKLREIRIFSIFLDTKIDFHYIRFVIIMWLQCSSINGWISNEWGVVLGKR